MVCLPEKIAYLMCVADTFLHYCDQISDRCDYPFASMFGPTLSPSWDTWRQHVPPTRLDDAAREEAERKAPQREPCPAAAVAHPLLPRSWRRGRHVRRRKKRRRQRPGTSMPHHKGGGTVLDVQKRRLCISLGQDAQKHAESTSKHCFFLQANLSQL